MMFLKKQTPNSINLILIGSGHYATGQTALSGETSTDKDFGVLLPSALYLRSKGWVDGIALCGRDGSKLQAVREKFSVWAQNTSIDTSFDCYPAEDILDDSAYIQALDSIPRPCAVLIAVPDDLHVEIMLECAKRNIPFFIVKPAVTNLDDFYKVKSILPKDLLAIVDYHKVFDDANILLHDDINSGAYGKIQHISSLMSQRRDMIKIYERWLRQNPLININHYLGSHYIHMTGYLTGAVPIDVRATQQFGFIQNTYHIDVADTIQTQVHWRASDGSTFASYHISGWADPSETESMTFQQLHLLTERGHIFSDQRDRGTRKVLEGGTQIVNPYFFNLSKNSQNQINIETKYGFRSLANFVHMALNDISGHDDPLVTTLSLNGLLLS